MKFSIFFPTGFAREFTAIPDPRDTYERLIQLAKTADDAGYESLLVPDHLTTLPPAQQPLFEAWSLITALAGHTTRIRLGQLVTSVGYRNPALAAKIASTVDVLSGGRLIFGIGAGWYGPDYTQYGFEFGAPKERLRRLDEAAQIIRKLWTQDVATFDGTYYQVRDAINEPKGLQKPHIPLLIAGGGEKVTLRTVAKYADASNIIDSAEVARHKYVVLKRHADDVGRDYSTIHRTLTVLVNIADTDAQARAHLPANLLPIYPGDVATYGLIGTVDTVAERIAAYQDAGVQELVLHFSDPTSVEQIAHFADTFIGRHAPSAP
jgi:F420-dependent oxidoreductase-like protein